MNRYLLLSVFISILAITEAMGFFSGYCFMNGYIFTGLAVYTLKIPIAAFTFWLFDLSKDKLMTFHWLETSYSYILGLIDKFVNSSLHVYIKAKIMAIRLKTKQLVSQYFGEKGFISSVKSHYQVFKPYVAKFLFK
jgi:hypothetical protein